MLTWTFGLVLQVKDYRLGSPHVYIGVPLISIVLRTVASGTMRTITVTDRRLISLVVIGVPSKDHVIADHPLFQDVGPSLIGARAQSQAVKPCSASQ